MEKARVTPKDFFLWAGAMISLYASVFAFLSLVFNYINYAFPDPLTSYFPANPYEGGISYEMATLIVLFPLFLVLMHFIRRSITEDPTRRTIWVRRWALYLTLFISGATIAGDLISLIMNFLNGEISERFVIKVALVFLIAGAGFLHFISDLRGYWDHNTAKLRLIAGASIVLILLTIGSGFLIIGTPMQARSYQFDEQRVQDLMEIQNQIIAYWQQKGVLPVELDQLDDQLSGYMVPVDPETGKAYEYQTVAKLSFKLCATFDAVTDPNAITADELSVPDEPATVGSPEINDSWYHDAGDVCYTRMIDPSRYPVNKPQ